MLAAVDQYSLLHEGDGIMYEIKEYLLGVICCAILCGILLSLVGKKSTLSKVISLICGVVLSAAILSPVVQIELKDLFELDDTLLDQASAAASCGENMAREEMESFIKSKVEAYILDKAVSMGAELEVEVTIDSADQWKVREVCLRGNISPYAKAKLSTLISNELDISVEDQQWTQ